MALTYVAAASWATGGTNSGTGYYKDLTFTSVAVGDLLIVGALSESADYSSGVRSVATQSGTTGTWTLAQPAVVVATDCDALGGYATATSSGTIVVRVQIRPSAAGHMGVSGVRIPAAEWTGTPTIATFFNDADGQVSVTLPGGSTYTATYWAGDWNALTMGTGTTPAGGTSREGVVDTGAYSIAVRTWTAQASGTRNYGPGTLSGLDASGFVIAVPEVGGASAQTVIPTGVASAAAAGTPTITTATTVVPTGVASAAAAGTPTLTTATTVVPTGVPTAAAAGTPTVTTATTVVPTGVPSAAAAGTPTVTTSTTVVPTGVPSAAAAGSPTITTAVTVVPTGVPSAAAAGTPTIVMGDTAIVEITRVALTVVPGAATEAVVEITRVALYVTPQVEPTEATVEITRVALYVTPNVEPTEAFVEITGVRLYVTAQDAQAFVEITRVALTVVAAVNYVYMWQERVGGSFTNPNWIIMERRAGVWEPLDS